MVNNDHCVDAQKPVVFALSLVGACIRVWLAHVSEIGWRMYLSLVGACMKPKHVVMSCVRYSVSIKEIHKIEQCTHN